jgi:hypothetical protein
LHLWLQIDDKTLGLSGGDGPGKFNLRVLRSPRPPRIHCTPLLKSIRAMKFAAHFSA